MFLLAELKDTVRIVPDQFHLKLLEAIRDEINRKLANKVLLNVGLCIALKDILSVKNSIIVPGDGASHTEVIFRYIVFRPSIGDIVVGKIRSCSREGVHVTMGFYDDILISPAGLQHPSRFEETEQAWVWEYPLDNGAVHDLFMDIGESIKFRVTREIFEECSPIGPPNSDLQHQQQLPPTCSTAHLPKPDHNTPYKIIGAINESGLGLLTWWDAQDILEEENDAESEE